MIAHESVEANVSTAFSVHVLLNFSDLLLVLFMCGVIGTIREYSKIIFFIFFTKMIV